MHLKAGHCVILGNRSCLDLWGPGLNQHLLKTMVFIGSDVHSKEMWGEDCIWCLEIQNKKSVTGVMSKLRLPGSGPHPQLPASL